MAYDPNDGATVPHVGIQNIQEGLQGNGVLSGLAVSERGAGANMSVDVATGSAVVNKTAVTTTSITNVTITASDPDDDRFDNISINSSGTVTATAGTASASPVIPDTPANEVCLAIVKVAAGVTSIVDADITDMRFTAMEVKQESFSTHVGFSGDLAYTGALEDVFHGINRELFDDCNATTGWTGGTDTTVSVNSTQPVITLNGLNISKTGTSGTVASADKTVTSRDFSDSADALVVPVFIKDQTTLDKLTTSSAIVLRLGSDSSNYHEWTVDKSQLRIGRNIMATNMVANKSSTTGTPSLAAMDYFYFAYNVNSSSDTTVAGDIILDDIHMTNGGILSFTSQFGGDFEIVAQVYVSTGTGGAVHSAGLTIDNKLEDNSRRVHGGGPSVAHNLHYLITGLSAGTHVVKVGFITNGSNPTVADNADATGAGQGTNWISVRELIRKVS